MSIVKQVRESITAVETWIVQAISSPRSELDRWDKAARFGYDLGRFGWRQLKQDRAPQMAAALSYRTLFGLLPVFIMAAVLIRAVRGRQEFLDLVDKFLIAMGTYQVGPDDNSLGLLINGLVQQALDFNLAAIGWVGLAILIYAAISLMVTVENCFNIICRAPEGRTWTRRVPMYWFVLTVGPVVIAITSVVTGQVQGWIESLTAWQVLATIVLSIWNFVAIWILMVIVYMLVPNRSIGIRHSLVGAAVATLLITIGRNGLGAYMNNAVLIKSFQGSLFLIPLFMFWMYIMWLFILFGLEVASTLNLLQGRRDLELEPRRRTDHNGLVDPSAVVSVMQVFAERFGRGEPTTSQQITEKLGVPVSVVELMLPELEKHGHIHALERPEGAFALATPPEQIAADDLMDIGFALIDTTSGSAPSPLLQRFRDVQRALAGDNTLAMIADLNREKLVAAQPS